MGSSHNRVPYKCSVTLLLMESNGSPCLQVCDYVTSALTVLKLGSAVLLMFVSFVCMIAFTFLLELSSD